MAGKLWNNGTTRRRFLKRTGGATLAAAFIGMVNRADASYQSDGSGANIDYVHIVTTGGGVSNHGDGPTKAAAIAAAWNALGSMLGSPVNINIRLTSNSNYVGKWWVKGPTGNWGAAGNGQSPSLPVGPLGDKFEITVTDNGEDHAPADERWHVDIEVRVDPTNAEVLFDGYGPTQTSGTAPMD